MKNYTITLSVFANSNTILNKVNSIIDLAVANNLASTDYITDQDTRMSLIDTVFTDLDNNSFANIIITEDVKITIEKK